MSQPKLMTKTQLMAIVAAGGSLEAFTHSIHGTFNVTAMRTAAPFHAELIEVPLASLVDHIRVSRVVEESRLADLPEASWRNDPGIILVEEKDGEVLHTIIDGHHRALRRQREGLLTMVLWEFKMADAIRPPPGFGPIPGHDWGDEFRDGKIVRRTR